MLKKLSLIFTVKFILQAHFYRGNRPLDYLSTIKPLIIKFQNIVYPQHNILILN